MTLVQPGPRILNRADFTRIPKCAHKHTTCSRNRSVFPLRISLQVQQVVDFSGIGRFLSGAVSARVRLGRPSALHWATGARRPFAAAGSGTGGAPACSFFSLSLQLACMQACTRIYCTSKIIKRGDKEAGKCLIGAWASMRYAVCAALVACRVQWSAMHAQCTQARGKAAGGSVISCQS